MFEVKRLERMILAALPAPKKAGPARIIPMARFLRPPSQFALPLQPNPKGDSENDH